MIHVIQIQAHMDIEFQSISSQPKAIAVRVAAVVPKTE